MFGLVAKEDYNLVNKYSKKATVTKTGNEL